MSGKDYSYLKISAYIGAFIGLFPVQNLKSGIHKFNLFQPFGICFMFFIIFNILCSQSSILGAQIQNNILAKFYSALGSQLLGVLSLFYLSGSYFIYFIWILTVSKYIRVWELVTLYDHKYCVNISRNNIFLPNIIVGMLLWIESITNAASFTSNMKLLLAHTDNLENFKNGSLILQIFNLDIANWLVSLHMTICQFSTSLAIQFIVTFSDVIKRRIDLLQGQICSFIEIETLENPKPKILIVSTHKGYEKQWIHIDTIISQIQNLTEIYKSLKRASNLFLLAYLSIAIVLITLYIFLIFSYGKIITENYEFRYFLVYLIVYLVFIIFKIFLLVNSGETLANKVRNILFIPLLFVHGVTIAKCMCIVYLQRSKYFEFRVKSFVKLFYKYHLNIPKSQKN